MVVDVVLVVVPLVVVPPVVVPSVVRPELLLASVVSSDSVLPDVDPSSEPVSPSPLSLEPLSSVPIEVPEPDVPGLVVVSVAAEGPPVGRALELPSDVADGSPVVVDPESSLDVSEFGLGSASVPLPPRGTGGSAKQPAAHTEHGNKRIRARLHIRDR